MINLRKGGPNESKNAAQDQVYEMQSYLVSAQGRGTNLSKVQDSVLRSASAAVVLAALIMIGGPGYAEVTQASYYTVASCMKESGQAVMANGRMLNDKEKTAASWDYSFGTRLKVTNTRNGKSVSVVVTDRGPARRLYRSGRKVDLSRAAFSQIADLKQGVVQVRVEEANDE